ncbi:MAG: helix-turn-helix transcriptional regulator [Armatimonadetes bacterium]|nr:helix-turn-helix transcriptional regulator [Armatimonadota bacterium]
MDDEARKPRGVPRRFRTHLNYGEAIRHLRQEGGMSRDALAAASDISPSYLYEVERGYKRPSTDVLAALAEALGRSPSEMLAHIEARSETLPEAQAEKPSTPPTAELYMMSQRHASPRESDALRYLLELLEHLNEDDIRLLLALARRLAGRNR